MKDFFSDLNQQQLTAVNHLNGPLLVLAGAGTGKTKVLTSRIANLIATHTALPENILAVTFTNKAASEMKNRVIEILGADLTNINIGTCHAISSKILRKYSSYLGYSNNFLIIDVEDQVAIIKTILENHKIDIKEIPPKKIIHIISSWKDKALNPQDINSNHIYNEICEKAQKIYAEYQNILKSLNAFDFGDLILQLINLLKTNEEILTILLNKIKYILVDEYQDTNYAQYLWLKLLSQGNNNICCVGDDDQSIYGFRGAEIKNILKFEKDYKNAKVIKLEENYRSTHNILSAANAIINNNKNRYNKTLFTQSEKGNKIKLINSQDYELEAKNIGKIIEDLKNQNNSYDNIVILVRAFFQTRIFEEVFVTKSIPYKIYGGLRFYERKEIKDIICYIRLIINQSDDLAFERIINLPKRGFGNIAFNNLVEFAKQNKLNLYEALKNLVQNDAYSKKITLELENFTALIDNYNIKFQQNDITETVNQLIIDTGYIEMLRKDKKQDNQVKIDNLSEFVNAFADFNNIEEFIEHISLISESQDNVNDSHIMIMTLHQAKGLEFDNVFLAGWEDGLFPNQRSIEENGNQGIEEERRLAYVGITRAKKNLWISYSNRRKTFMGWQMVLPSRFIKDIPNEYIENINFNYHNLNKKNNLFNLNNSRNKFNANDKIIHDEYGEGIVKSVIGDVIEVKFSSGKTRYTTANNVKIVS